MDDGFGVVAFFVALIMWIFVIGVPLMGLASFVSGIVVLITKKHDKTAAAIGVGLLVAGATVSVIGFMYFLMPVLTMFGVGV